MERAKKRIAIIGSGISGLVAAYEIKKAIIQENLPFDLVVIESKSAPGGMIRTLQTEDGPVDVGASSFDIRREDVRPFLKEIGLEDKIQYSIGGKLDRYSSHGFVSNERPTYRGLPLNIKDIMYDKELSTTDKLKVLYNFNISQNKICSSTITTARELLDIRFCKEVSNLIAYPNYPENIFGSMELCPPEFFDPYLPQLFEKKRKAELSTDEQEELRDGTGQEYTLFGGMSIMIDRLLAFVGDDVEVDKQLSNIERIEDGLLMLSLNKKEEIRVGSLISTIPISELANLANEKTRLPNLIPKTTNSSMGTILFQFPKNVITKYPSGFGFVIPKRSAFHITKGTFLNRKWASFADSKYENLVVEIGRRQEDTIIRLPDDVILSIIEEELKEILGLNGTYAFARVYRWHQAVPHLSTESRQEIQQNEERFRESFNKRGVYVGGNGLHGYGMHHAIHEGKKLAQQAISYMKKQNNL